MKKDNPVSLAQQQETALAQEFLAEYKKLVEKYGFDFTTQMRIVKVNANPNNNTNNLNPLGKPAK